MKFINNSKKSFITLVIFTNLLISTGIYAQDPISDECGYFTSALSTRALCDASPSGKITFDGLANIYDNPSTSLSTCLVDTPQWVIDQTQTCESGDCVEKPGYTKSLSINYNQTPTSVSLDATPAPNGDSVIIESNITLDEYKYTDISFNYNGVNKILTFEQPSGRGNNPKTLTVNNITDVWNIIFSNNENIEIGTITSANNNSPFSMQTTGTPDEIEIQTIDFKENSTIYLEADESIKIESFTVGRSASQVTIKSENITINNLTVSNTGSGIANILLIGDTIDIGSIDMGQGATITVQPYTAGTEVILKSNTITASSSSELILSSGHYYTESFNVPGTSNSSSVRASDSNQIVNFYINGDFKPGNNPGINSAGNNGNFGTLSASNFRIFINGDLETGGGGTTFNTIIYVEGNTVLGNPTYIKGALSSQTTINIGQDSKIYYSTNSSNEAYFECPIEATNTDLCYDTITSTGFNIAGMGIFYGVTTPIRNVSGEEISNATIVKSFDGINMSFMSKIKIDDVEKTTADDSDEAEINQALTTSFGGVFNAGGIFDKGVVYRVEDYDDNQTHTIYDYSMFEFSMSNITLNSIYTKDGVRYFSEISACTNAGSIIPGSVADIVNNFIDDETYNNGTHYITTKVANKSPVRITAVYIDKDSSLVENFDTAGSGQIFSVIPYLTNDTCTAEMENIIDSTTNEQLVIDIAAGNSHADGDILIPDTSYKSRRFELIVVDTSTLSVDAQQCMSTSSTTGNFARINQCANNKNHYITAFGNDAWQRCGESNGEPCLSNNHGDANENSPTYDPDTSHIYNNELGCYMCTFNIQPVCTTDNFAIRPDRFELSSSNSHMPDLLRSGSDYNLTINAYNYSNSVNSTGYNQTKSNMEVNESIILASNGDTSATMYGIANWSTTNFSFTNGVTNGGDVAGVVFDDVGKVTLKVKDKNWAAVDINDTVQDCSEDGAYICGEGNVTYIPHHFNFKDINITNNDGVSGKFTYIANLEDGNISTYIMAAKIQATIVAENKNNLPTKNFQVGAAYYEKTVSIDTNVSEALHGDANTTSIPTALLGFSLGEKTITWNETNLSKVLRFNFPREVDTSLNPFEIDASDLNISANSTYTGTSSSANIDGAESGLGDGKATFIYGRTNAPRQRFSGHTGDALIHYEAYCHDKDNKNVTCNKNLLPNGATSQYTDDPRWFKNTDHISSTHGNTGDVTQKGTANFINTGTLANTIGVTKAPLSYQDSSGKIAPKGYSYKTTMENNASSWLIYNKYKATDTTNEFEVEFESGDSDWAGKRETSTTTKKMGTNITNRRSMW